VARALAYAATGGSEGVGSPGDCKVLPLAVPGGQVRVQPGAVIIRSGYPGVAGETYMALCQVEDLAAVAPTAGAARSDLVVARIDDPQFAGQAPGRPSTEVIPNVPAGTTRFAQLGRAYPAKELARIDIPANTAAVTAGMVTDLRSLAQPRSSRLLMSQATPQPVVLNSVDVWVSWPGWNPIVDVPPWATNINVLITLQGVGKAGTDLARGELRGRVGNLQTSGPLLFEFTDPGRSGYVVTVGGFIAPASRGMPVQLFLEGHVASDSGAGRIGTNPGSHMAFDVQFTEQVA